MSDQNQTNPQSNTQPNSQTVPQPARNTTNPALATTSNTQLLEFRKTLSAFLDAEAITEEQAKKIMDKYNQDSPEDKQTDLRELNNAWTKYERDMQYVTQLNNEQAYQDSIDVDVRLKMKIDADAQSLYQEAQIAQQEADQAGRQADQEEAQERRQQQQLYAGLQTKRSITPGSVLSLDELIGGVPETQSQNTPTTFSHTSSLAEEKTKQGYLPNGISGQPIPQIQRTQSTQILNKIPNQNYGQVAQIPQTQGFTFDEVPFQPSQPTQPVNQTQIPTQPQPANNNNSNFVPNFQSVPRPNLNIQPLQNPSQPWRPGANLVKPPTKP